MMKKGQAALEYMSTYGWALLVIAMVLIAFFWLGVFTQEVPERCDLPGMNCENALLSAETGGLRVKLTNNFVEKVQVCSVYCSAGPTGENGLPLVDGAEISSAKAGSAGCKTSYSLIANTITANIIDTTVNPDAVVVVSDGSGSTVPIGPVPVGSGSGGGVTVPDGGGVTVPDGGGVTVPDGGGVTVPSVEEGTTSSTAPIKVAMLQANPYYYDGVVVVSVVDILGGGEDPYLEIGQSKTFLSNRNCLDEAGNYPALEVGGRYVGTLYVEYVLRNDAKGTPARLLTGEVVTTIAS